jgi:hypothetical protein
MGTNSTFLTIIGENCESSGIFTDPNKCRICSWHDFAACVMFVVCFVVEGKHTVYRMSAATPEEKDEWIKCVR